jgi:hypothetical protein
MNAWDGLELGRVIVGFSALLYAGVWVQVSLLHWGGGFRKLEMWGPVVMTPVIVVGALMGFAARDGGFGIIAAVLLALGVVDGLIGIFYHVRGIAAQVGGLGVVRNYMTGPPPVLPLAFALVGVLGLLGLLWDA